MTDDTAGRLATARERLLASRQECEGCAVEGGCGGREWIRFDKTLDAYEQEARRQGRIEALREVGCSGPHLATDGGARARCRRCRLLAEAEGREG